MKRVHRSLPVATPPFDSMLADAPNPAKLLAAFVVDTNETELTIPFGN